MEVRGRDGAGTGIIAAVGSSWTWTLYLRTRPDADVLGTLLSLAGTVGFRPRLVGHPSHPILGREGDDPPVADPAALIGWFHEGYGIDLVDDDRAGVQFRIDTRSGPAPHRLSYDVLAGRVDALPHLHARLTDLWVRWAGATGAVFGEVTEEWSLDSIWHLLPQPHRQGPPENGFLPFPLGWWTYFDAGRFDRLEPLPDFLPAVVRRTPDGGAVIDLSTGWGTPQEPDYKAIHVQLAAVVAARPRRPRKHRPRGA
jgi:hypothetical protein